MLTLASQPALINLKKPQEIGQLITVEESSRANQNIQGVNTLTVDIGMI